MNEIENIISSDLPIYEKSKLIQEFYEKKHSDVKMFKGGGILPTETIEIGDKEYDVEIADTQEKRTIGLSKCRKLNDWEGMLFVFEEPTTSYFTMKDTSIDLDIIFIDTDGEVISVESVLAHTEDPIVCQIPYQFVLEVSINSGIKPGDELDQEDDEFSEEDKDQVKKSKMLVLDSNGDVQMTLVGGERIVSRVKTKQLVKAALKAYKSDSDSDYRRVGRIILQELIAQDSRDPQYVEK